MPDFVSEGGVSGDGKGKGVMMTIGGMAVMQPESDEGLGPDGTRGSGRMPHSGVLCEASRPGQTQIETPSWDALP